VKWSFFLLVKHTACCDQIRCEVPETRGGGGSGKEYMKEREALKKTEGNILLMGCCLIVLRCYFLSEVVMNLSFKVV
jgi:hypothetical protein